MNIGLTYDLRADYLAEGYGEEETAEFDRPDTIEAIEAALTELGYQTDRIGHARHLIGRLAQGDRWDLVFNIAEGLRGLAREAQVPAILDVYDIPYTFSDPLVLSLALHKGLTKTIVRQAGIPTPDFALVERPADVDAVDLPFPLFAKPVAEGTSKGISAASKILDRRALRQRCESLLRRVPPAGAGRDVPLRPGVHRRHHRQRRTTARGPGHDGNPSPARGRGRGLFLREQGAVRGAGPLPAGPAGGRPAGGPGRGDFAPGVGGDGGPRRRPGGRPLRRPGRAPFPGTEPPAGPAPAALRPADPLRLPGDSLRGPDRPDRPFGPAEDGQARAA